MPTTRPLKSVNLEPIDHKRLQAIAGQMTEEDRVALNKPRLPRTTIREANSTLIEEAAIKRGIHIDQ